MFGTDHNIMQFVDFQTNHMYPNDGFEDNFDLSRFRMKRPKTGLGEQLSFRFLSSIIFVAWRHEPLEGRGVFVICV